MHALAFVAFMLGASCSFVGVVIFVTGIVNSCCTLIFPPSKGIRAKLDFRNLGIGIALMAVAMLLQGVAMYIMSLDHDWMPL